MILSYRLARASLKSHRMRTVLTTLGVTIGVFIISLILIVSSGLRQSIINQVSGLSSSVLVVHGGNDDATGMEAFSPLRADFATILTERNVTDIKKIPTVAEASPMMFLSSKISAVDSDYSNITTVATSANFPNTLNLKLTSGSWFDNQEVSKPWVILGDKLARGLLDTDQAGGQVVNIKGQSFTVIGILSRVDQPISLAGVDIDKAAFISMQNGLKFSGGIDQIGQIIVRAKTADNLDKVEKDISTALTRGHLDSSDFSIRSGQDAASALSGWLETITMAALIFAGISLIVGGIGIMNIMLVSVTERIHEIGIRKAVGATRSHILNQFLVEALLITLYGGIIGLGFAYGVAYLITLQFSLPLSFEWWIFAIGLGVPLGVGLLFGLWPAVRAARQDPIVALKQLN